MLVLSRKNQESVVNDSPDGAVGRVRITVVGIRGGRVRLGFDAAVAVAVARAEVWERRQHDEEPNTRRRRSSTAGTDQVERWEDDGGGMDSGTTRPAADQPSGAHASDCLNEEHNTPGDPLTAGGCGRARNDQGSG
jgi:carbon storage regulator CsrA